MITLQISVILAMGSFSSREVEQSQQNVFTQIRFRPHIAQTAVRSDFFPIAMKTMKFVCYNMAGS